MTLICAEIQNDLNIATNNVALLHGILLVERNELYQFKHSYLSSLAIDLFVVFSIESDIHAFTDPDNPLEHVHSLEASSMEVVHELAAYGLICITQIDEVNKAATFVVTK